MYSSGISAARLLTGSHRSVWVPRLVPRFALVDRLEVIKSLYGRTATWPQLSREDVRNAALQRPVAFAAVHVLERRWCHQPVGHVVRLCNGWDAIVVEIADHGELDLPVADVARTSWERHCAPKILV